MGNILKSNVNEIIDEEVTATWRRFRD